MSPASSAELNPRLNESTSFIAGSPPSVTYMRTMPSVGREIVGFNPVVIVASADVFHVTVAVEPASKMTHGVIDGAPTCTVSSTGPSGSNTTLPLVRALTPLSGTSVGVPPFSSSQIPPVEKSAVVLPAGGASNAVVAPPAVGMLGDRATYTGPVVAAPMGTGCHVESDDFLKYSA